MREVPFAHVIDPKGRLQRMDEGFHAQWFLDHGVTDIPHPASLSKDGYVNMSDIADWEAQTLVDALNKGWYRVRSIPTMNKVLVHGKKGLPPIGTIEQILDEYQYPTKSTIIHTQPPVWEGTLSDYIERYDRWQKKKRLNALLNENLREY